MRWARIAASSSALICLASAGCGRTGLDLLPPQQAVLLDAGAEEEPLEPEREALRDDASPRATDEPDAAASDDAESTQQDSDTDQPRDAEGSADGLVPDARTDGAPPVCPAAVPAAASDVVIDDLEDGDAWIRAVEGRVGAWYTVNDGSLSGTQQPAPDSAFRVASSGAQQSAHAARTWGSGFSGWGAALGVRLHGSPALACTYDASARSGIRFYARGSGTMTLSVISAATVPAESGGSCRAGCFDYYATRIVLTPAWSQHEVSWRELRQTGWGTPVAFDPSALLGVEFAFGRGLAFDLSIDDLAFF